MALEQNTGTSTSGEIVDLTGPVAATLFEEDTSVAEPVEVVTAEETVDGEAVEDSGETTIASTKEKWRKGYRDFMSEISSGL
jgi:hypothetical protein